MAVVFIPAQLRRLTGGRDRILVAGSSVGALIDAIDATFPGFRARVVDGDDVLSSLAVSVDGDLISRGLREPVRADSEVHFVPALGGGQTPGDDYTRTFEVRGDSYNEAHLLAPAARGRECALLLERLDLAPRLRVLDVPAGGGFVAAELHAAEPSLRVLCVEPAALFAAGIARGLLRVRGALTRLPIARASIDRVASLAGTHHLPDRAGFLAECRRVLRPGGRIVVADARQDGAPAAFLNGAVDRLSATGHRGRFFARGEAAEMLLQAGFTNVAEELVEYAWQFEDLATLVAFCRAIFGLVRADLATVEPELRAAFVLDVDASGARLPWSLVYAVGVVA